LRDRVGGGTGGGERGRDFTGKAREILLYGLKFSDRTPERHALIGVGNAEREKGLQRAGRFDAAHGRAHQHQRRGIEPGWRLGAANGFGALEGDGARPFTGEIFAVGDTAVGGLDQGNRGALVAIRHHRNVFAVLGEGNAAAKPAQSAVGIERDAVARTGRGDRHCTGRGFDAGARQQPAGN